MISTKRILMYATFINTFGNGAYLATGALFLTRSVGLAPAQVAIGLSAAAAAGALLTTPMAALSDRFGPRDVQVTALLVLALGFAAMILVRDLNGYIALACVIAVGDATVKAANGAMIANAVAPGERVRTRALMRSTNNAGIALGTLAGGVPLMLDSRMGYLAVLLLNAATFAAAAAIVRRAPKVVAAKPDSGTKRMVALRDRPFVAYALVDGMVIALLSGILALALPLWIVTHTKAPPGLVSVALLVNTIGCVTLQVWASRGTRTATDAIPVSRRGTMLLAASCVLFGATAGLPAWWAGALVLAAAVVHVLGELWVSSAAFAVVFDLPPDWAQGQYQGVYQTGRQIGNMIAPPLLTALVIGLGAPGWLGLAAIFAAAALATPALIRWALSRTGSGYAKSAGVKALGSTRTSQLPEISRITASTP